MRSKKINISKIAEIANVHPSTVSRALNGSPLVNEKTRSWIQSIARANGYIPDAVAKSLHSGRTSIIGIIVPEISNTFYSCIIDTIEQVVAQEGYNLILSGTRFDPDAEILAIETMLSRQVDALVVCAPSDAAIEYVVPFAKRIPIILADITHDCDSLDHIYVDEQAGILSAIRHLKERGYARIGCIADCVTERRLEIFTRCMEACGLKLYPEFLYRGKSIGVKCGYEGMYELADHGVRPDAVFATRDNLAIGIMRAAIELEMPIPDSLAIVGYDDIGISNYMYKKLTTVHQPADVIGQNVAELILRRLWRSPDASPDIAAVCLTPQLVIRESS